MTRSRLCRVSMNLKLTMILTLAVGKSSAMARTVEKMSVVDTTLISAWDQDKQIHTVQIRSNRAKEQMLPTQSAAQAR